MNLKRLLNYQIQKSYGEILILTKVKLMNFYMRNFSSVIFPAWIFLICLTIFSFIIDSVFTLYFEISQSVLNAVTYMGGFSLLFLIYSGISHLFITKILTSDYQWKFYEELSEKIINPGDAKEIDNYYAFVTHCANTLKREDTLLWVTVICLYFQENNLTLNRNLFIDLLEKIMTDPYIKSQYINFFDQKKNQENFKIDRQTRRKLNSLKLSLSRHINLISWPHFYGWYPHENLSLTFRIFSTNTKEKKSLDRLKYSYLTHSIYLLPKMRVNNKLIHQSYYNHSEYEKKLVELGTFQSSQLYNKAVQIACQIIKEQTDGIEKIQRYIYPIVCNPDDTSLIKLADYAYFDFPQYIKPL
ncbi:hypothetical protein Q5O24_08500 [Eubacteriaceae bacterium ES3]|nr:hypothetical protein Q5O24_08500 [Eubacteriaceae bacterium ES3]